jgi:hypothetical protein
MSFSHPTAAEQLDRDHAAALRDAAQHDLLGRKQSGEYHPSWTADTYREIPVWHMRPGMTIPSYGTSRIRSTEGVVIVSAPQYDQASRTEHVQYRDLATGALGVLSTPYRTFIWTEGPAWMFSDEFFHLTHSALGFSR